MRGRRRTSSTYSKGSSVDLLALLRKEAITLRRNLGLFVVLLLLLPGALVAGTAVFEQTIPRDVPVGVVADDDATEDDVTIVRTGLSTFGDPVEYDAPEEAREALEREEVYLVIHVPGDLMSTDGQANVTVVSDHTFVPFEEPVNESADLVQAEFDRSFPAEVTVGNDRVGEPRTLSSFLVPTGLFAFVVLYALIYLPYQVRTERLVLDRLQTESRLDLVVASKLLFYGAVLLAPLAVVAVVTTQAGYDVAVFSPLSLATVGLTFTYLGAFGLAVLFALGLEKTALFVNLGVSVGVFALSSLVYPVGFFSTTQTTIARILPTHYSAITLRSGMLRDAPATLYADYLGWLTASVVVSLVLLKLSLVVYERRK